MLPRAWGQTVLNSSFESPSVPDGSIVAGSGDNWKPTGNLSIYTNGYGYGTTSYGNQWLAMGYNSTDAQTLSLSVKPSAVYTFSVQCAQVDATTGGALTLTVTGGGMATPATATFTLLPNQNFGGALPFTTESLNFTPLTSDPLVIVLQNGSLASNLLALDNVVLTSTDVPAVPEPATWLGGLGAVAMLLGRTVLRRRRTTDGVS